MCLLLFWEPSLMKTGSRSPRHSAAESYNLFHGVMRKLKTFYHHLWSLWVRRSSSSSTWGPKAASFWKDCSGRYYIAFLPPTKSSFLCVTASSSCSQLSGLLVLGLKGAIQLAVSSTTPSMDLINFWVLVSRNMYGLLRSEYPNRIAGRLLSSRCWVGLPSTLEQQFGSKSQTWPMKGALDFRRWQVVILLRRAGEVAQSLTLDAVGRPWQIFPHPLVSVKALV